MQRFQLLLLAFLTVVQVHAQDLTVYGKVLSAQEQSALPGANVALHRTTYGSKAEVTTDTDGTFSFSHVQPGMYTLQVSYPGYKPLVKRVLVQQGSINVGVLELRQVNTTVEERQVADKESLGEQKGDSNSVNTSTSKTAPKAGAGNALLPFSPERL